MGWHSIFNFEIRIFFSFFEHLASPAKRFSFTLEYESPMSERHECHDSVHLEEKTKMPKTSAVWDHFKLSEDKTKAVCQICDLKLAYHNSTSSLKNHLSSVSCMPIVYCWCKKTSCFYFTHDKTVHLICLKNTCEYGSHKNVILFKLFVN